MFQARGLVAEPRFPHRNFEGKAPKSIGSRLHGHLGEKLRSRDISLKWFLSKSRNITTKRSHFWSKFISNIDYLFVISFSFDHWSSTCPSASDLCVDNFRLLMRCCDAVIFLNEGLVCASLALGFGSPLEPCQHPDDMCLACLVCLVCTVYGCIRHTHVCTVKQGCLNGYECRQGQSDKVTKWYKFIGSSCRLTLEARHCHSCTSGEFNRRKRDLAPRTQPLRHRVRPMCPIQGERRRLFRQKGAQVQLTPFFCKSVADGDAFTWPSQHASQSHVSTF